MIRWNEIVVAVPSFNRAGLVRCFECVPFATLFVAQSQVADYKRAYQKAAIVVVPDAVEGDIARKRQWIIENARSQNVLMVDDDVFGVSYWENSVEHLMSLEAVRSLILQGFNLARECAAPLWGIGTTRDRRAYSVMRPFSLLSPVLGPWTGHCLPHGLVYDSSVGAKEDYDMFLQAIHRYRRVFRLNKYQYRKADLMVGGVSSIRTEEREKRWAAAIMQKWGRRVISYDAGELDGKISIPIPGC